MKKRFLVIFFSIVAVAALACGIAACDTKENGDTKSDPGYEVTEPSDTETSGKGSSDGSDVKGETVSVTSVSLDKGTLSMGIADTYTFVVTVLPEDATNREVTWSSSDESVATVSDGVVSAVSEGTAVVTAVTADGGKVSTCIVTVSGSVISVDSVSLNTNTFTMETGGTYTLTATVLPGNATNKQITWSSSDESVVTVSDGVVTAVSEGNAAVSAVTVDGGKVATCIVTVSGNVVSVTSVSLDKSAISFEVGDTYTLTATVLPEDATNKQVTWSSSEESVVTVSDGLITAVSEGIAVVTVVTADGGKVSTCIATVTGSYEDFLFEEYGNGYALVGYTGSDSVLVVPSEYNGKSVIAIGAMPIDTTLDTLYVTGDAFYENGKIREVILPESIRTINVGAFAYSSVTAVTIPSGCRAIYDYVFYGCNNLKTVTFNGGTVTAEMFTGCDSVENIVVGEDAAYSDGVFSSFVNLKTLSVANLNTTAKALFVSDDVYSCPDGFETLTITEQRISTNSGLIADCSFEILLLNKYPIAHIYVEGEAEVYIDEFDYGNYTLVLVRTDGVPEYVDFIPDYISSKDRDALKTLGEHSVTVVYEEVSCTFTVNLSEHQFEGLTFEDEIFVYDGTLKYVYVSGCPDGAKVTYTNNGNTEVGEYVITAVITKEYYTTLTLTATITIVQPSYSITYVLGKDEAVNNNPSEYEYGVTLTLNSPSCDYFSFIGWYLDPEFSQEITIIEAGQIGEIVIYAEWISVFIMSGGTITGVTSDVKNYTTLVIPEYVDGVKVTEISSGILKGCSSLENIVLPFVGGSADATEATPSTLFGYIFGTSSYSGGKSTKQYYSNGSYSTYYIPSSLSSVTITGGNILYGAFYNCTSLSCVVIPNSAISIDSYAFYGCTSLISIMIPDSVISIDRNAFNGCTALKEVNITELTSWCLIDFANEYANPLYYSGNLYVDNDVVTNLIIPDSVISIKDYAFYHCASIANVTISDSVLSIGSYAFSYCTSLKSVSISDSVTEVGEYTFYNCSSLTDVSIGNGVTTIPNDMFGRCTSLKSVTIPEFVTSIDSGAFCYCSSLISVTIPDSVVSIGSFAFAECSALKTIVIPASLTLLGNSAFYQCTSLTEIYFNAVEMSNLSYDNSVFYRAGKSGDGITVVIGAGVTKIPSYIFYPKEYKPDYTPKITTVIFEEESHCVSIGRYAFCCSISLESIIIPDSVTSIGNSAFWYCISLTSLTIGNSVTSIEQSAFASCSSLESITLGIGIKSIEDYAFSGTSLNTVYYCGNADSWLEISFGSDNTKLTSATIYFYTENIPDFDEGYNYWHYINGEIVVWTQEKDKEG